MSYQEGHIDRIIREAQERGEFDDLPGAGKPLDLGNPQDPDWWVKQWVKREKIDTSATLPPALALRKERESFPDSLLELRTEPSVRAVLEDYNRRVREEHLRPTFGTLPRPITATVDIDDMVRQWSEKRASLQPKPVTPQPVSPERAKPRRWWRRR